MKLKRLKSRYKMPPNCGIEFACIKTRDKLCFSLAHVSAEQFLKLNDFTLGQPTVFMRLPDAIHFHPTPDAAYDAIVRYMPPVKEI